MLNCTASIGGVVSQELSATIILAHGSYVRGVSPAKKAEKLSNLLLHIAINTFNKILVNVIIETSKYITSKCITKIFVHREIC